MVLFWAVVAVIGLLHLRAVFTQNVNWDEFVLLERAVRTAESGEVLGGGRPGLGTILLVPFAEACENAVEVLVRARVLWFLIVVGGAVAFWFLLKGVLPRSRTRWISLALALSVWVLAPVFLRSSTQVRTDQPAVLFGLLGGLALLGARRRLPLALVAGLCLGVGFLFSQKLLYVMGLVGVLVIGDLFMRREWEPRREAWRLVLAAGAFLLVVVAYREIVGRVGGAPSVMPVAGQLDVFAFYREGVGWGEYRRLLPLLAPQLLPLLLLPLLTVAWIREPGRHGRELALAWALVAVGLVVAIFHAGRFGYFFLTLGLFPAAAVGFAAGPLLERTGRFVARGALLTLVWMPLLAAGLLGAAALMVDLQSHQREALDFVDRNFPPEARGFDAASAFACRADPDPFPVRFPHRVWSEFLQEGGEERGRALIEEFRARPVAFMILPLEEEFYPDEVRDFWQTRYVPYHGPVRVPGREIDGPAGWSGTFEVVVPGDYAWRSGEGEAGRLEVDGLVLEPGGTIQLTESGTRTLRLPAGGAGLFVLALDDPPAPGDVPFYVGF